MSPPWLLRSLAQGTPDRCLHMSLDASRHLPPSTSPHSQEAARTSSAPCTSGMAFPQDFADKQARQTFVQQLQHQETHQQWGEYTRMRCKRLVLCFCMSMFAHSPQRAAACQVFCHGSCSNLHRPHELTCLIHIACCIYLCNNHLASYIAVYGNQEMHIVERRRSIV